MSLADATREKLRVRGASIRLAKARKDYGENRVLHDIDLDIAGGEFMTLLGPSGSGKTTTLNLIAGLTDITDGELQVDSYDLSGVPIHKRGIGVVFQNYALFPHMTVFDNVAYPLKQRKIRGAKRETMVQEALQTVGLEKLEKRYPSELSGGQQQRVALARAIVFKPRVLLMDEPLGALDKKLREWLQQEIRRIHHEVGSTFVYVTHDQDEALSMSDRIAVFKDGRIDQVGTPEELYERPASLFVGEFLGESTVLAGRLYKADQGMVVLKNKEHNCWAYPPEEEFDDGCAATVLIRPEHLQVQAFDASESDNAPERNTIPAQIEDVIYQGAEHKYKLLLASGTQGVARVRTDDANGFKPGDKVCVSWDMKHAVVHVSQDS